LASRPPVNPRERRSSSHFSGGETFRPANLEIGDKIRCTFEPDSTNVINAIEVTLPFKSSNVHNRAD
jgi:hypothetical protein